MPNWCYTTYVVEGDAEELRKLYDIFLEVEKENTPSDMWLGYVVRKFGEDPNKMYYCRGRIIEFDFYGDGSLRYIVESAWVEMEDVRRLIVRKLPSLDIYYQAEEGGCEYYATNDKDGAYFPERYVVHPLNGEDERIYCIGEEQLFFDDVAKVTGKNVTSVEAAEQAMAVHNKKTDYSIELKIFSVYG